MANNNIPSANDIYGVEGFFNQPSAQKTAGIQSADVAKTGAGLLGGFVAGGPSGMVAVGLMQLAGGILSAMFGETPRTLTPQEKAFDRMTKFYGRMGARTRAMRATVANYRGVTPDKVTDIGWNSTREMIANVPYRENTNA